jgi:hypothetical protein
LGGKGGEMGGEARIERALKGKRLDLKDCNGEAE